MSMYLPEKLSNPELFTGRRKELAMLSAWIDGIPKGISRSMAILSRRKTGKTALMQRLYNLTFARPDGVIPFYYEVKEGKRSAVDFACEFFLTFLYQYTAYKTRNTMYLHRPDRTFDAAIEVTQREGLEYLARLTHEVRALAEEKRVDRLWSMVMDVPRFVAASHNEYIVQMVDEFQYLNSEVYWNIEKTHQANDFAAGYMSTAEYRMAPLLISGSWIGWLRDILHTMLPSRFRQIELEPMPEDETVEMIYTYARVYDTPISEEVVYAMSKLCEGNPFYVSAVFETAYADRDLTTMEGLVQTLEFETLHERGYIRAVWMEYLGKVFYKVNQENAKNIVLHLCKHRDREVSRQELLKTLKLSMTDRELEEKLHSLVKSDIIERGRSNFYYRGVQDNVFDKVFRGEYADDIREFDPREITQEYRELYEQARREYRELLGKHNQMKGLFAEYAILHQLRLHAHKTPQTFLSITQNLPADFAFVEYEHVWSYKFTRPDKSDMWIDIFARAREKAYSLIGEVKNRSAKPFSLTEAEEFTRKAQELRDREEIGRAVLFVFSRNGFTQDALDYFQKHKIAYSDDERWLGN